MEHTEVLENFEEWLDGQDYYSTQYVRYMKSLIEKLFDKSEFVFKGPTDPAKTNKNTLAFLLIHKLLIENEIKKSKNGAKTQWTTKTIQNYQSGFCAFEEFIVAEGYDYKGKKKYQEELKSLQNETITYTRKQMADKFKSRLVTQDRVYENILYPARLLNKIFNNNPTYQQKYKDLLNKSIGNIKFIVDEKGNTVKLSEIVYASINVESGSVTLKLTGGKGVKNLYTQNGSKKEFKQLKAKKGAADLSLDHDTPLEILLNANSKGYPEFKELSKTVAKSKGHGSAKDYRTFLSGSQNIKEWTKVVFDEYKNSFNTGKIYDDLCKLYEEQITMTIMQKDLNSKKSNNR
ncbi:MAG: hypothetical protein IKT04_05550 [Clostridia bacterium]|nr:hypothetical protein [Clostridia bacterium]